MNYAKIKSLLTSISDPVLKLETVMDLGKTLQPAPPGAECAEISGCASRVQICKSGGVFYGAADSALVRGIVAIILSAQNDGVRNLRGEFDSLNLNLGAGRLNGVASIIGFLESVIK
ncbi:MAG: SufE family protein [Rickettsiales bacterium]|jgi:sulfur transfer protein SufE|nr:SufE family protein [Rickettsiales bacterium]